MITLVRKLFGRPRPQGLTVTGAPTLRIPRAGDPVWWAPKKIGCTITEVKSDGSLIFQGGDIVVRPTGKTVPRWTVATVAEQLRWDERTSMWILGQGEIPKNVRGEVVTPGPINASIGSQPGRVL